jgi:arginase
MARALRATGLFERLGGEDGGEVTPPPYRPARDPGLRVRNPEAIRDYSYALAERLGTVLDAGGFPVVLGGDCSILLGSMLALRRRGRPGLAYLDGHTDFALPETSPSGGVAGMDLALLTGRGPAALAELGGYRPLLREEDVVALGYRDLADSEGSLAGTAIRRHDLHALRRAGIEATAAGTREALSATDGFWIHVDVDVLDSTLMPAVDSPQPDGLGYAELGRLLVPLLASEQARGIQFTIFDPDLDPAGRYARELAEMIVDALDRDD